MRSKTVHMTRGRKVKIYKSALDEPFAAIATWLPPNDKFALGHWAGFAWCSPKKLRAICKAGLQIADELEAEK